MLKITLLFFATNLLNVDIAIANVNNSNSYKITTNINLTTEICYTNQLLEKYGRAILESLKETKPEKLLELSLTISEFKKTVKKKTLRKNKAKFFAED